MNLEAITITRRADYEKRGEDKSEFKALIRVVGGHYHDPSITIPIPEEQLEPIVAIIAQVVAANMADAAERFREEVQASLAGYVVEQEQITEKLNTKESEWDESV